MFFIYIMNVWPFIEQDHGFALTISLQSVQLFIGIFFYYLYSWSVYVKIEENRDRTLLGGCRRCGIVGNTVGCA